MSHRTPAPLHAAAMKPKHRKTLGQFFTHLWVAEALVERYFPELDGSSQVLEPACGNGAFLRAIPAHVPVTGVELDPAMAAEARRLSGRPVLEGDFTALELDLRPTHIIGNPPFERRLVDRMLTRAHELLPKGGRLGFILPAYMFQTPSSFMGWAEHWSIRQEMLPRTIFGAPQGEPLISKPVVFALFSKDARRSLVGFALYPEAFELEAMKPDYAAVLKAAEGSIWREAVAKALISLGGEAGLDAIYTEMERRRPTKTAWWREKVRQVLLRGEPFVRQAPGRYGLAAA